MTWSLFTVDIYIIKGVWGGGRWSVVGDSVTIVVIVFVRGQASKRISSRVCEDLMHCCRPVPDPIFLVKTVHLPCTGVTHESEDDEIQYMQYCAGVYPLLTLNRFR